MTCLNQSVHHVSAAVATLVVAGTHGIALGGSVQLGNSGWIAQWNASLDSLVEIDPIDVIGDTIFLQKAAEFRPTNGAGALGPIAIQFVQTGPSTINAIVMDDEIITNSTGQTWTGFRMFVAGNANPVFNPAMTASSGGGGPVGFSIDPFTTASFINGNTELSISGGSLPDGEVWFPGGGGDDGQLWINVQSGAAGNFRSFTLSEQPQGAQPSGPVCVQIVAPPNGMPSCGSSGNGLTAQVSNTTSGTVFDWEVVSGPCVISLGNGTTSITYSIGDACASATCCVFQLTVDDSGDSAPPSVCERQVCCVCPAAGDEGRTPGFWKQPHHFGHWPQEYCPSSGCPCGSATLFCDVFDCAGGCGAAQNAYAGKTLLEVLRQGGGKFKALGRHAVAALLNSAMDDDVLNYKYSTQQVIDMVNHAIAKCKSQPTHGKLGDANEQGGGDLGGQSHCSDLDLDGAVNQQDLAALLANWGSSGVGDLDNDGLVGMRDLNILLASWGEY